MNTELGTIRRRYSPSAISFDEYDETNVLFHGPNEYREYAHDIRHYWDYTDLIKKNVSMNVDIRNLREKNTVEIDSARNTYHYVDNTIEEIASIFQFWGEDKISRRLLYFASNEDLEDGDVPLTLESARGFLLFFRNVKADGNIRLACSPEGNLCVSWGFLDRRSVTLWFIDKRNIRFAAIDRNGNPVRLGNTDKINEFWEVTKKLIQAGIFAWNLDVQTETSLENTMLFGNVEKGIWTRTALQWLKRSFSEQMSNTSQQIGSNTLTSTTDILKLIA